MTRSGFATLRDALSFLVGAGILLWSIVVAPPPPEPLSVGVGAALVGLPATSLLGGRRDSAAAPTSSPPAGEP